MVVHEVLFAGVEKFGGEKFGAREIVEMCHNGGETHFFQLLHGVFWCSYRIASCTSLARPMPM